MCFRERRKSDGSVFPCGHCPQCIDRRIMGWSFRLMQELKYCTSANFITLTYGESHVPVDLFGNYTLRKSDVSDFVKRLRKAHGEKVCRVRFVDEPSFVVGAKVSSLAMDRSIKYFAVGEYGGHFGRPHIHVLLFNARVELIQNAWGLKDKKGVQLCHFGEVDYGDERGVCEASISYCFKYLQKSWSIRKMKHPTLQPEFSVCSKGLGIDYLTDEMCTWHAEDIANRMYCVTREGFKVAMPRYYKDKIFFDGERSVAARVMIDKLMLEASKISDPLKYSRDRKEGIDRAFESMFSKSISNLKL